jgi:hypothetical protein
MATRGKWRHIRKGLFMLERGGRARSARRVRIGPEVDVGAGVYALRGVLGMYDLLRMCRIGGWRNMELIAVSVDVLSMK